MALHGGLVAETMDLADCLEEVRARAAIHAPPSFRVEVKAGPGAIVLLTRRESLVNALLHLIVNAIEALPRSGAASMSARIFRVGSTASSVELQVSDDGIGMSLSTIARAFDPGFTTKGAGAGGDGLPTVTRFAWNARGMVLVESEPGWGTTIALRLPALPVDRPSQHVPTRRDGDTVGVEAMP